MGRGIFFFPRGGDDRKGRVKEGREDGREGENEETKLRGRVKEWRQREKTMKGE